MHRDGAERTSSVAFPSERPTCQLDETREWNAVRLSGERCRHTHGDDHEGALKLDRHSPHLTLLRDVEWSKWSDREIAKRCGVSREYVNRLRPVTSDPITSEASMLTEEQQAEIDETLWELSEGEITRDQSNERIPEDRLPVIAA